ncbi:helix-turn-helix transcriptional regulator [Lysobacter sp. BMK333-48F3]|uniref:winged helix-turn-helix transcriptional regulator n=1 Tax=Lysobacter sp. BMK333-48F3 TaxID=2867962 RepID=UPI001C8CE0AA|nr:helix-turn-helix domain-containing protein [Lysobacter sp. BMK333-48F3]MBX9403880.1 helix-turn-helix transcriptional regulator [Lysobacter sp. BMK333-48F3]
MNKNAPAGNHSRPNPDPLNPARSNPARPNPLEGCPLAAAFAAIGGKWKLTILYWLAHGELHFAGLRGRVAPISPKVLAEQLRELEADGIVVRTPTGVVPAPVIYQLTDYGLTLSPIVEAVRVWGEGHLQRSSARQRSDGMGCGERLRPRTQA